MRPLPRLRWDPRRKRYVGGDPRVTPDMVLRLVGQLGKNGKPLSVVRLARHDIALQQVVRLFAHGYFERGGQPSGAWHTMSNLTAEDKAELRAELGGVGRAHAVPILEGDLDYKQFGADDAEKTQLLPVREDNVRGTARWLGMNPISLGDMSRSSYNTAEHARLDFLGGTLRQAIRRLDLACSLVFLPPHERRGGYFVRTDIRDWVVGDRATRAKAIQVGLGGKAYMTVNEAREMDGLPGVEGGDVIPEGRACSLSDHIPGEGTAE